MPHHLDVAVISYKFNELRQQGDNDHIIELDPIEITQDDFKRLFYYTHHNHNTFAVNRQYPAGQEAKFYSYVSFNDQSIDNILFNLSDEILDNIESDLGISRHMLSTCSLINITKELNAIKSLRDLPTANVTCSLKWSDIVDTLRVRFRDDANAPSRGYDKDDGYNVIGGGDVIYLDENGARVYFRPRRETLDSRGGFEYYRVTVPYSPAVPAGVDDEGNPTPAIPEVPEETELYEGVVKRVVRDYEVDNNVPVVLSISVQFITPNEGVSPTIVKFNYNTKVDISVATKC
jgi:hypothetical protein